MSTSLLVAKERQPGSPFGLGHKQAKKPKKYGANAPQLRAIRCSIDFCVMLCNEQAKKQKNTAQMRHSCALFDALSIFVQCCATSKPIGSCACLAGGCGCARADSVRGRGAATRGKCRRCSVPGWQAAKP